MDYSVTIVAKTTLSLSKNAGTGRLAYEIQGADKSSIVEATTNVDWIKNFNYAEPGYVQFDYTALDEGVESRSGQITLSYTGAADVVVTVNQGGTMTFELTIDPKSITANGCAMQIVPSNESETYLCAFMTKEYVDSFGLSGNIWLVSFKISYLCLPLFYETRTTPSCHPSGCAYRQL